MLVKIVLFLLFAWGHGAPAESKDDDESIIPLDLSYLGSKLFGTPSRISGKQVHSWNENSGVNPEEMGEYAEGDILFPSKERNGVISEVYRWQDGIVPYEFASNFTADAKEVVERAMNMYHKYTCITFRPKDDNDKDYIEFINTQTGCWSSVGRVGEGRQQLNLQYPGCVMKIGTSMHELMHAVGFAHEQSRPERDEFVDIFLENVDEEKHHNFQKYSSDILSGFNVEYDYNSVMHYSAKAFSNNDKPTIVPKEEGIEIGQRDGFSVGDILKINRMYNCSDIHDILITESADSSIINV